MIQFPERRKYEHVINGKYILSFWQATLEETDDFIQMSQKEMYAELVEYIKNWVMSNVKIKGWRNRLFHRWQASEITDIWRYVEPKLHVFYKSLYDGVDIPQKPESRRAFLDARPLYVVEQTKIPLDQIKQRITFEQWLWFADKMTYEYLESYDAGKMVNNKIKWKQGLTPEQKALRDQLLAAKGRKPAGSM